MTLVPDADWYRMLLAAVQAQQAGVVDRIGRPWAQHFERVALRTLFRNPAAPRAQLEAALLHDAFMDRGGGVSMLNQLGLSQDAIEIIRLTTPPPGADYYRNFEAIGPAECDRYLDYVRGLVGSGNRLAIEMKLADITDTIDACRAGPTPDSHRPIREPVRAKPPDPGDCSKSHDLIPKDQITATPAPGPLDGEICSGLIAGHGDVGHPS